MQHCSRAITSYSIWNIQNIPNGCAPPLEWGQLVFTRQFWTHMKTEVACMKAMYFSTSMQFTQVQVKTKQASINIF